VETFRSLIKEQQDVHASLRSFGEMSHEPEVLSPERAVRGVLDWYAGSANKEMGEHMFTVRSAWDALSYDRYEPGSREEGLAGSVLQAYYGATREPAIKPDFSVVLFRSDFVLVSEKNHVKTHKNQWVLTMSYSPECLSGATHRGQPPAPEA
jgi:hypothetical protein